jgi:hypothetical protein
MAVSLETAISVFDGACVACKHFHFRHHTKISY